MHPASFRMPDIAQRALDARRDDLQAARSASSGITLRYRYLVPGLRCARNDELIRASPG